jgi:hypothetical protein
MAGTLRKYETDEGTIIRIRATDSTAGAPGNTEPAGAVDDIRLFAKASEPGNRRNSELNARGLILGRNVGTAPNVFVRRTFVPYFTKAAMDAVAIDSEVTINGVVYTVRDRRDEA